MRAESCGKGGVEVDEARGLARRAAGALGGVAQILVALGVDDDHRLAAPHGLGDQQVEEARLARARGPHHEEMALGVRQGQAHRPLALPETVDPVRAEARRVGTDHPRRAHAQQVVHQLGVLAPPVEAPAEPEVRTAAHPALQGGRGDEGQGLAAQAVVAPPDPQRAGKPEHGHDQGGDGQIAKGRRVQVPPVGGDPGDRAHREPHPCRGRLVVGAPGVLVAVHLRAPRAP